MIRRDSLAFALGWRLAGIIALLAVAALFGLVLHAQHIEADHPGNLVHDVLREFFLDMAWTIPLIAMVAVGLTLWALRQGLRPVIGLSEAARAISPMRPQVRLPAQQAPAEMRPLVDAINGALDRLAEAYQAQRRFAATAAHELRTPLAVLRAGLERLPDDAATCALRRDVSRMTRIVTQLLELARLDAPVLVNAHADLVAIARDMLADRAPGALAAGVALAFDAAGPALAVQADRGRLEAILGNLLDNAVAHAPPGSEVRVGIGADATLSVEDDGPGIPAEARGLVFDRFFRGAWTTTSGAGLGLSIVAEAAHALGATVAIVPRTPGTRFEVRFMTFGA